MQYVCTCVCHYVCIIHKKHFVCRLFDVHICECVCIHILKWTNVVCKNFRDHISQERKTLVEIISWQHVKQGWNFSILNWICSSLSLYAACLTYCCWHTTENCLLENFFTFFLSHSFIQLHLYSLVENISNKLNFLKYFFLGRSIGKQMSAGEKILIWSINASMVGCKNFFRSLILSEY